MAISRDEQCTDSHGGIDELYVFEYVKYARSQITVIDNYLTLFPFSIIYDLNSLNKTFTESVEEEDGGVAYSQSGGFDIAKIKPTDNYKQFAEKDWRIIIKDNNNYYRLIGLHTGVKIKFTKEKGTNYGDFNGFKFSFETKEEDTAPYLNDLSGFIISPPEGLTTSITLGGLLLTQNSNALTFN